jgi:hypothetical protein
MIASSEDGHTVAEVTMRPQSGEIKALVAS